MEQANVNAILQNLNDIVLDLVEQQDESIATEKALIHILTEILPEFGKKYEQAYIAERAKISPRPHDLLASLEAELRKRNP